MDQDKGKQKSYGIHARFGEDDMDVVKDLNLNRALAYTPEILTAAFFYGCKNYSKNISR